VCLWAACHSRVGVFIYKGVDAIELPIESFSVLVADQIAVNNFAIHDKILLPLIISFRSSSEIILCIKVKFSLIDSPGLITSGVGKSLHPA
jgi:hypothetical protein